MRLSNISLVSSMLIFALLLPVRRHAAEPAVSFTVARLTWDRPSVLTAHSDLYKSLTSDQFTAVPFQGVSWRKLVELLREEFRGKLVLQIKFDDFTFSLSAFCN